MHRRGPCLAHTPWNAAFPGRVAFLDLGGQQTSWTADRSEFLGYRGQPTSPAALASHKALSGSTGARVTGTMG
ncbi:hypothetical protein ACTFBY_07185 [Aeromonas dhakensis]|uniref:hypothetical protein n=1 Tax=Aeromonas dhakensis TaxID=196024 RepID=UPI00208E9157|nr:hypothetical protein [Aeromonas dhakensis]USP08994.1 hypothetical protein L1S45_17720 [Aeromonas dhakensis]